MQIKSLAKSTLRPIVHSAWPAVEALARAQRPSNGLQVRWSSVWTEEFDRALEQLPPIEDVPHALYRALLRPTTTPKQHALVSEHGQPIAIVSMRRCRHRWEPVGYQCIPGAIAPALSLTHLSRALRALNVDFAVPAGLDESVRELRARYSWCYDWYKVELDGDYQAHWRKKKRQYTINRARKRCAEMERRIDGEGDLQWIVEQWREQWADDPGQEIVATEDRLNFWPALQKRDDGGALRLHTLQLLLGDRRAAGIVFTSKGDTVMLQCGGRDPAFDDAYSAAAVHLASIEWAKEHGFKTLDMAGGEFKRLWGPRGGYRYGALFRPEIMDALYWAAPE